MLGRRTPDLILLDLGMSAGEMSGMELLARLRAVLTKSAHYGADVVVTIKRILESG